MAPLPRAGFERICGPRVYPGRVISLAVFLLALGATARITHFVNEDELVRPFRDWVLNWGDSADEERDTPYLAYFLTCPWCVSIWAAGAVTTLAYFYGEQPGFFIPAAALAISWLYGVLAPWVAPPEYD